MSMSTLLHIGWLSAALCACGGSGGGQGTPDAQGSDGGSGGPSAWAVGAQGAPRKWNGSAWEVKGQGFPIPSSIVGLSFDGVRDIWPLADGTAWAVATDGFNGRQESIVVKWDGSAWTKSASFDGTQLNAIWGTGERDVWLAGNQLSNAKYLHAAYHWDGTAWMQATMPDVEATVLDIWGAGADTYFAATDGVRRFDGAAFTVDDNASRRCPAVWGTAGDDVWAACGGLYHRLRPPLGWAAFPLTITGAPDVQSIHGTGPTDVWAVGKAGSLPIALHWDGTAWASTQLPSGFATDLLSVFTGGGQAWAVGEFGATLHWDGTVWQGVPSGTMMRFEHVRGR
jgi:hypothetical protein